MHGWQLLEADAIGFQAGLEASADGGHEVLVAAGEVLGVSRVWQRDMGASATTVDSLVPPTPSTTPRTSKQPYTPLRKSPEPSLVRMTRSPGPLLTLVGDQMVPLSKRQKDFAAATAALAVPGVQHDDVDGAYDDGMDHEDDQVPHHDHRPLSFPSLGDDTTFGEAGTGLARAAPGASTRNGVSGAPSAASGSTAGHYTAVATGGEAGRGTGAGAGTAPTVRQRQAVRRPNASTAPGVSVQGRGGLPAGGAASAPVPSASGRPAYGRGPDSDSDDDVYDTDCVGEGAAALGGASPLK